MARLPKRLPERKAVLMIGRLAVNLHSALMDHARRYRVAAVINEIEDVRQTLFPSRDAFITYRWETETEPLRDAWVRLCAIHDRTAQAGRAPTADEMASLLAVGHTLIWLGSTPVERACNLLKIHPYLTHTQIAERAGVNRTMLHRSKMYKAVVQDIRNGSRITHSAGFNPRTGQREAHDD